MDVRINAGKPSFTISCRSSFVVSGELLYIKDEWLSVVGQRNSKRGTMHRMPTDKRGKNVERPDEHFLVFGGSDGDRVSRAMLRLVRGAGESMNLRS